MCDGTLIFYIPHSVNSQDGTLPGRVRASLSWQMSDQYVAAMLVFSFVAASCSLFMLLRHRKVCVSSLPTTQRWFGRGSGGPCPRARPPCPRLRFSWLKWPLKASPTVGVGIFQYMASAFHILGFVVYNRSLWLGLRPATLPTVGSLQKLSDMSPCCSRKYDAVRNRSLLSHQAFAYVAVRGMMTNGRGYIDAPLSIWPQE